MATSLGTLRTALREEIKIDPNGKIWSNSVFNDNINAAYLQVQADGQFNWPGQQGGEQAVSLVSGTQEYALSTDLAVIELVLKGTEILSQTDFTSAKVRNLSGTQGTVNSYYLRGNNIGFDPIPDSSDTVTVYYRTLLDELTADGDNIELDDRFAQLIVKYAAYLTWSGPRGNESTAASKYNDYLASLNRMKLLYMMRDTAVLNYKVQRGAPNRNIEPKIPN